MKGVFADFNILLGVFTMPKLIVNGGKRLEGELNCSGAKNSVLPLLAATLLIKGQTVLHNCPQLSDVDISLKILSDLGCKCKREGNTVTVDATVVTGCSISDELMREMRSSIVFLGAIAARLGKARLSAPGGCELGPRPIDLHIDSLRKMGLTINEHSGILDCKCCGPRLRGTEITLSFPSVGATENIILAAATCEGRVIIRNCAREPEICDLANFLNKAGAKIYGCGGNTIVIDGVKRLTSCEHTVIPDRIVASTYIACAAVCGSEIYIKNVIKEHIMPTVESFNQAGCVLEFDNIGVRVKSPRRTKKIDKISTMVYPGFPTDACPPIMAMSCYSCGSSMFVENIFENRFKFTDELKRMGAKIKTVGRVAVIEGRECLCGAKTVATDLRGGAALVVAALGAEGTTEINNVCYIDRGYEQIEQSLSSVGADIRRIN